MVVVFDGRVATDEWVQDKWGHGLLGDGTFQDMGRATVGKKGSGVPKHQFWSFVGVVHDERNALDAFVVVLRSFHLAKNIEVVPCPCLLTKFAESVLSLLSTCTT